MCMNIWYNEKTGKFVMFYQGKKFERSSPEALAELVTTNLKEQRLDALYQAA